MKQVKTKAFDVIASFCDKGITGLRLFGTDTEVLRITDVILQGKLDNARKDNGEYRAAITATLSAISAQTAAREEVSKFITAARDVLKQKLGSRFNQSWGEVGFLNATLTVPRAFDKQLSLVKSMELYFDAHPEAEVVALNLTHQHAADLHAACLAANTAVNAASVVQRNAKVKRDTAMTDLRAGRQLLFRELRTMLSSKDARWLEFGFNVPGDMVAPDAPETFTVAPGLPGHLSPSWSKTVGADRYRLFAQVVGVDEKPAAVETTNATSFDLGGLTYGAQVKLCVVAANAAGESQPSETVEIVVP